MHNNECTLTLCVSRQTVSKHTNAEGGEYTQSRLVRAGAKSWGGNVNNKTAITTRHTYRENHDQKTISVVGFELAKFYFASKRQGTYRPQRVLRVCRATTVLRARPLFAEAHPPNP